MNIGLVRHFKVLHKSSLLLNPTLFKKAMQQYDAAPIISNGLTINNSDWDVCYCSTLPRAKETAHSIYNGKIIYSTDLIEVPMQSFTERNIYLPSLVWHIFARKHWYQNKSTQKETRKQTIERANKIYTQLIKSGKKKILIVSHGFFIRNFYRVLIKNGFVGKIDLVPQNGKLYSLTNNNI